MESIWSKIALLPQVFSALVMARIDFWRKSVRDIVDPVSTTQASEEQATSIGSEDRKYIETISWLIPRISSRVPWRSDCLVQAMAARSLLKRREISSKILLGATTCENGGFLAHAWLRAGDMVVTGKTDRVFHAMNPTEVTDWKTDRIFTS